VRPRLHAERVQATQNYRPSRQQILRRRHHYPIGAHFDFASVPMAAAFRPVNSPLASEAATNSRSIMTPSSSSATPTPRPSTAPHTATKAAMNSIDDDGVTPTRENFSPAIAGQRPLPSSPFPHSAHSRTSGETDRSRQSRQRDSAEMDLDESDGEQQDSDDGSDDESVDADGVRTGKKKKSQRFYCTDYPPCKLSFTRSEHLARHIRKHTGERPFQCHCSRRFSRLDNLRQHAQTVHVNEDIPINSLAATGSRFQRQMRTERVRQAGNRARASTSGSAGGPPRGHSKSLSTSSINSISSINSNYTTTVDSRRRPPPLIVADPRSRPMDPYRQAEGLYQYGRQPSPTEYSTPTSATFSTGHSSPQWASGMGSPRPSHSRSQSMYTPSRRLSVPSATFQAMQGQVPGRPVFGGAGSMNSSNSGAFSPASNNIAASPTISIASGWSGRRDSVSSSAEDWRRRTWHPDSRVYGQAGHQSQLSSVASQTMTGPEPRPPMVMDPATTKSNLQLPGIESFDQPGAQRTSTTPPRRQPSPMMVDAHPRPPTLHAIHHEDERRNLNAYDASLQRGLNRLDIDPHTPPRDGAGAWASEANRAVQRAQMENARMNAPAVRFDAQPPTSYPHPGTQGMHYHTMSAPNVSAMRESKRRGWYNGPMATHREERMDQEPRASRVDRMVHPNFTGFSGFPARDQQPSGHQQQQPPHHHQQEGSSSTNNSLGRLEALVAVATGEGAATAAY